MQLTPLLNKVGKELLLFNLGKASSEDASKFSEDLKGAIDDAYQSSIRRGMPFPALAFDVEGQA